MSKPSKPLTDYQHPAVAIDLALVTVAQSQLHVLLVRRPDGDVVGGDWALPGGFVHMDKSLDQTVSRIFLEKANVSEFYLEQLGTFGALDRDPRGRVISIAYFALVPAETLQTAIHENRLSQLARLDVPWDGETGGEIRAMSQDDAVLPLAFDHAAILGQVVKRLRGKLDYTAIGLELLPPRFTLREVQEIHEAILGKLLTKPAFRRKILDRGLIRATGQRETASAFRPAEYYERA